MQLLRAFLLKHDILAVAIGLAALALRLAVPSGFMPSLDQGRLALTLCPGAAPAAAGPSGKAEAMPGMGHDEGNAQARSSCAFADLSLPAIGGARAADPTESLVFAPIAALVPAALPPARAALRLRPPKRGPPLPA